ncbi:MAG: hypothetical protein H6Q73_2676 [Firmicutes bacterium]|nr:hypothetical protein [Bacillota bacterium]
MKNNKNYWKQFLVGGMAAVTMATGANLVDMQAVYAKVAWDGFDFDGYRSGRDACSENTGFRLSLH